MKLFIHIITNDDQIIYVGRNGKNYIICDREDTSDPNAAILETEINYSTEQAIKKFKEYQNQYAHFQPDKSVELSG